MCGTCGNAATDFAVSHLIQQFYIGCYDCAHKNVFLAHPQNCLATPLLVFTECKIKLLKDLWILSLIAELNYW